MSFFLLSQCNLVTYFFQVVLMHSFQHKAITVIWVPITSWYYTVHLGWKKNRCFESYFNRTDHLNIRWKLWSEKHISNLTPSGNDHSINNLHLFQATKSFLCKSKRNQQIRPLKLKLFTKSKVSMVTIEALLLNGIPCSYV